MFCVDEVIIFSDGDEFTQKKHARRDDARQEQLEEEDRKNGYTAFSDPSNFIWHLLTYLETPPNLRRDLIPYHQNLKTAGTLPSLDMPHHLRKDEWCRYREGICTKNEGSTTLVDAGLSKLVRVGFKVPLKTRVTLDFGEDSQPPKSYDEPEANVVAPDAPRLQGGYYWGFNVRLASKLSDVFSESPFEDGYEYCIGTSERGGDMSTLVQNLVGHELKHVLMIFGGPSGLERAVHHDELLSREKGIQDPSELFDSYVNILHGQGSRTIRTEEALWIGLGRLKESLEPAL